jgi:lysophospholipid acyltransferase (LPLAT)-like uncharacterized protein
MPSRTKKYSYRIFTWIGPWLMRLLGYTVRIKLINSQLAEDLHHRNKPFLLCTWHGRLYLPVFHHRGQGIVAMVSRHADGELISRIVHKMGYGTVRGSTGKGGREAFLQLLSHLKKGGVAAMIPDGPLGPACEFKMGTVLLAKQAGCPLIPITFAARPFWKLNSWDRTILPKPFSRAVICYGDPIVIPPEATAEELENWRLKIQTAMNDLVRAAEDHLKSTAV